MTGDLYHRPDDDRRTHSNWTLPDGRRQVFFKVPMPTSMHGAWAHHDSEDPAHVNAFDAWRRDAGWAIRAQGVKPLRGHLLLEIRCEQLDGAGEIQHRIEPVIALLRDLQVLDNDASIIQVIARWFVPKRGGALVVITEAKPSQVEKCRKRIKKGKP